MFISACKITIFFVTSPSDFLKVIDKNSTMVVFPNAKINIGLNITARRADGYHILTSAMLPIGWTDILEIVPSKTGATTLTTSGNHVDCPPESNLVMKAYRALSAKTELPPVDIYLRKIIPDGAGLGGGSSDAAFTLSALNAMFELGYTKDDLAEIAGTLGADCPFFIYNSPMIAEGIGTDLTPTAIPHLSGNILLVVKPDIHISTAQAYAGVTPRTPQNTIPELLQLPLNEWPGKIVNDFEESLREKFPQIDEIKNTLYQNGAQYASLSGSGSAVYGIFSNDKMAEKAMKALNAHTTFICRL